MCLSLILQSSPLSTLWLVMSTDFFSDSFLWGACVFLTIREKNNTKYVWYLFSCQVLFGVLLRIKIQIHEILESTQKGSLINSLHSAIQKYENSTTKKHSIQSFQIEQESEEIIFVICIFMLVFGECIRRGCHLETYHPTTTAASPTH